MSTSPCFKELQEQYPDTYATLTNRQGIPTVPLVRAALGAEYKTNQTLEDNCLKLLENLRIAMHDAQVAPEIQETLLENIAEVKRVRPPMQEPNFLMPVRLDVEPEPEPEAELDLPPAAKRRRKHKQILADDDEEM